MKYITSAGIMVMTTLLLVACKKNNALPQDNTSSPGIPAVDTIKATPTVYTDTFEGVLHQHFTMDYAPTYDTTINNFRFYVTYADRKKIIFRQSYMANFNSVFADLQISDSFIVADSAIYHKGDNCFHIQADSLNIHYERITYGCLKNSSTTGGGYDSNNKILFSGKG